MKKYIFCFIMLLFVVLFMNGCTDFHSGERPYDYGRAIWTAESLDIWFLVKDPYDDYGGYMYPEGEMSVGDETVSFTVDFDKGISVFFMDDEESLFAGTCKFSPEKLTVNLKKFEHLDNVFNGEVEEIVFIRTAIDE